MFGMAPAPAAIKLSRSSYESIRAGMYRKGFVPSSLCFACSPCEGRVFVSIDASTRRSLCCAEAERGGSFIHAVLGGDIYFCGVKMVV